MSQGQLQVLLFLELNPFVPLKFSVSLSISQSIPLLMIFPLLPFSEAPLAHRNLMAVGKSYIKLVK